MVAYKIYFVHNQNKRWNWIMCNNLKIEIIWLNPIFQSFVSKGGGLLVSGQAWNWDPVSADRLKMWNLTMANGYPGNK